MLDKVIDTNSKFIQVYAVVMTATPKYVYKEETGQARLDLRVVDDTGTSMPLILFEMQKTDSFLAGDVLAMRYPTKTYINGELGLSCLAGKTAAGIGTARESELMTWYASSADQNAFTTSQAQEEQYAEDLAAYKRTLQDKDPDEFKALVENYAAKHPFNS